MKFSLGSKMTAREFRPGGQGSEPLFNDRGELNASSKEDAFRQLATLANAIANGKVMNSNEEQNVAETEEHKKEVHEQLVAAYNDSDRSAWSEIGSLISLELKESADREGFMRRILLRGEAPSNSLVRHRIRRKTVTALVASGPAAVHPEMVRGQYVWAPEFEIRASIGVSNKELNQGAATLLDDKYLEAQEQIMRQEDLTCIELLRGVANEPNSVTFSVGGYTPASLVAIQFKIRNFGIDCPMILAASNVMQDFLASPAFISAFDPVTTHENIMTGTIARLYGTEIVTDQFRDPRLKVLNAGELFALGSPEFVGGYTDRGPVNSVPRDDMTINNFTGKGWNFDEMLSMTVHTGRGVAQGRRA